MEKTLAIIKPDAVAKSYVGEIINRIEKEGLKIVSLNSSYFSITPEIRIFFRNP